jgi:choline kinase
VQSRHPTALLIDRHYSTADDDPVLVPIRNGKPVEFLKGWKGSADLIGESVGFFKIDPRDKPLLIQEIKKRSVGMRRQENYDEIMRSLVLAGRFRFEDISGLPWTEIDFPEDVEHAQNVVFPAIVRYEYKSYPKQKNPFQNRHLPKFI